jgi:hypothetical protein
LLVPPGRGELHLAHALDQLIRVRQDGAMPLLDVVERQLASLPVGSTAALLSATVFLELERLAELMAWMRARGVRPVLVAVDKDSFQPIDVRSRPRADVAARCQQLVAVALGQEGRVAVLSSSEDLETDLVRADWLAAS